MINQTTYKQFLIAVFSLSSIVAMKIHSLPTGNIREAAVVPNFSAPALSKASVAKATENSKTSLNAVLNAAPAPFKRRGSMSAFLTAIAKRESNNDPTKVNYLGMMGKYQFSHGTLKRLGYDVTREQFLNDSELQDTAMMDNLRYNYQHLYPIIRTYGNTWKDGIYITTAGILAGAHLVGIGGVKTFFYPDQYNYRTVDGNGVSVGDYIQQFAGYRISLK